MVYLDSSRQSLVMKFANAKSALEEAEWDLFCYDNHEILYKHKLTPSKAYDFGIMDRVLHSNSPLEKCVFDKAGIKIISPIMGGTGQKDRAIYQCKKCKTKYTLPLNAKDKKAHDKRMNRMVFA